MNWKRISTLSKEDIDQLCKKHNVKLPDDYCNIIGSINGGALASAHVDISNLGSVPYSRNVTLQDNAKGNAFSLYEAIDNSSRKYFPFGSVGNGDYFCFNMQTQHIVYYQHETQKAYDICETFSVFITLLKEEK